jgi:hypothetical protein
VISNEESFEEQTLFVHTAVAASNSDDWYEKVTINESFSNLTMVTMAQCNLLPLSLARRLQLTVSVLKTANVIWFNGERTTIEGDAV